MLAGEVGGVEGLALTGITSANNIQEPHGRNGGGAGWGLHGHLLVTLGLE